jgi:hypothetical protein
VALLLEHALSLHTISKEFRMSKYWFVLGGAAVVGALMASTASAQPVSANFNIFDTKEETNVVTPTVDVDAYAAPMSVEISSVSTGVETVYAFCIDATHQIGASETALSYQEIPLTSDTFGTPGGTPLSTMQIEEIGALANYGAGIAGGAPSASEDAQLAAVQDAIWDIEYPVGSGFSFTPTDARVNAYVTADVAYAQANALRTTSGVTALIPTTGGATQGFVIGGGSGVPEPASWALMILGMSGIGAVVRRRRVVAIV